MPSCTAFTRPCLPALLTAALLTACGGGGDDPERTSADAAAPDQQASALRLATPTANTSRQVNLATDLVVQLRRDVQIGPLLQAHRLTQVDQFGQRPIYQLRVPAGASLDAVLAALQQDPRVRFAERHVASATPESRRNSVWLIGGDAGVQAVQWAAQQLNLPAAHALSTGQGVRVAVLDTGVDHRHPALAGRMARSASGAVLGRDFVDDDFGADEPASSNGSGWGHGTHVAGLVALAAPGARLMPVRVLDGAGRGNTWVLAEGLAWAVDPDGNPATDDGAHVINLSLGTLQPTQLLTLAVNLATCQFDDDDDDFQDPRFDADRARCGRGFGAVVASAAGNSGSDVEQQYPAAEDVKGTLAVAASTRTHRVAPFSNWGSWVKIAAPGEALVSTLPGGRWGTWSGTSMAAPLVAGSAALLLATVPKDGTPGLPTQRQWLPEDVMKRLTDRSAGLCSASLRRIDPLAALADRQAVDPTCP
jgi:subtilisin family serine protease